MLGFLRDILMGILAIKVANSDFFARGVKFVLENSYSLVQARLPPSLVTHLHGFFSNMPCTVLYYVDVMQLRWVFSMLITAMITRMIIRMLPFGGR